MSLERILAAMDGSRPLSVSSASHARTASAAASSQGAFNPSALMEAAQRVQARQQRAPPTPTSQSQQQQSQQQQLLANAASHHASSDELAYRTMRRSGSFSSQQMPQQQHQQQHQQQQQQQQHQPVAYSQPQPNMARQPVIVPSTYSGSTSNFAVSSSTTAAASSSAGSSTFAFTTTTTQQQPRSDNNRVRVVVRVRPPIPEDLATDVYGSFDNCTRVSEQDGTITLSRATYDDREFRFDRVIHPEGAQEDMYQTVAADIVEDVLKGYNGTVLAYGQTGTGKTWTIFGPTAHWDGSANIYQPGGPASGTLADGAGQRWVLDSRAGVIPRAVRQVFHHIDKHASNTEFRVTVSFLQIYMENIMDLLDVSKANLAIREDPKQGIFVDGLTQVAVRSPADMLEVIQEGARNRAITATNMNKVSSRSHVILMLTIEQRARGAPNSTSAVKRGVLTIVDLAGSERVAKSLSEGQRLEEAKKINKSLSALGNCVAALTEPNCTYVPFRDSKLTRLLTDSLGGNSKTCLCANIGPAAVNYDESHSTLLFATRAMAVRNHAVINEVVDFKTLTGSLQRQITQMQDEKSRLVARNVDLENEILRLREEVDELRKMHQTTTSGAVSSSLLSSMPASQQQVHAPIPSLTATDAHRPLQIHVRPSSAFGAPSPRTGPFTSFNNENVAPMSMVQPNTPSAYFGQSVHNSADPAWELRERELVAKFSNIIQHLQVEIAKQNFAQTTAVPPSPVTKAHQNHTSISSNNVGNLAAMGSNNSANAPYAQILASLLQSVTGPSAASQAPPKVMAAHTHPITPVASSSQPPLVEGEVVVDQLVNSIVSIPALRNRLVERLQQAASQ